MNASEQSSPGYELVVVSGDELETFELPREGTVTLGRAADNVIQIDHPLVTRSHVRLTLGASVMIEDLGGSNELWTVDRDFSRMNLNVKNPLLA